MERLEQALRDELQQMPDRLPSSTAMLGRVRRRQGRNRLVLAGAMSMVLVLTVGVGLALRGDVSTEPPTPPGPASASLKVPGGESPFFTDPDNGFVMAYTCDPVPCVTYVASTVNGGASWQLHPMPEGAGMQADDHAPLSEMRVFDSRNVLLDTSDGKKRWASSDGAKTWREMPVQPNGTVDEVPLGAQVRPLGNAGAPISMVVTRPDGNSSLLAHAPNISTDLARGDFFTATDGSYWYEEADETHGWLFYSRDRGRTWHQLTPPGKAPVGIGPRGLMTHDGRTVYWHNGDKAWRTTDDGAHWTQLSVPTISVTEGDYGFYSEVRRDNGLQFTDSASGKVYVVSVTGTTFTPVAAPEPAAIAPRVGVRYSRQLEAGGPVSHSVDGVNWVEVRFGS